MTDQSPKPSGGPGRAVRLALAGSGALALAAAAAFVYAVGRSPEKSDEAAIAVEVASGGVCKPTEITVPAGRVTFEIRNTSDRPVEWEILDGVMVVEERENILPGYSSRLTARLAAGSYDITCGFLTGPRGKLTVTPVAAEAGARTAVPTRAFIAALSEWRVTLGRDGGALGRETRALAAAITAGDLVAARERFMAARLAYKRLEAAMGRFADLEAEIDPAASTLPGGKADSAYVGFQRVADDLVVAGRLDGLAPLVARLADATARLGERLRAEAFAPADIARLAGQQARRLAEAPAAADPALDLAEVGAGLDGLGRFVAWLAPVVEPVDAALAGRLAADLGTARREVADRPRRAAALEALADDFAAVNQALGLE